MNTVQDNTVPTKQHRRVVHLQKAAYMAVLSYHSPGPHITLTATKSSALKQTSSRSHLEGSNMQRHPAPSPAFSLPCLVGEEGTYVPLVPAALYGCATSGRSWDADSRISLAGSMLPSSLPRSVRWRGELPGCNTALADSYTRISH